jgi:hypothetical protein
MRLGEQFGKGSALGNVGKPQRPAAAPSVLRGLRDLNSDCEMNTSFDESDPIVPLDKEKLHAV